MIHSTAFNRFSVLQYLQNRWELESDSKSVTIVLHFCSAHVMHSRSYKIDKNSELMQN